jgi:hypothetical protein
MRYRPEQKRGTKKSRKCTKVDAEEETGKKKKRWAPKAFIET